MSTLSYPLPSELRASLQAFFGDLDPNAFLEAEHDSSTVPVELSDRLHRLRLVLEGHLRTIVANATELADPEYTRQARGEVIATLIALRELWTCFPELRHGTRREN